MVVSSVGVRKEGQYDKPGILLERGFRCRSGGRMVVGRVETKPYFDNVLGGVWIVMVREGVGGVDGIFLGLKARFFRSGVSEEVDLLRFADI